MKRLTALRKCAAFVNAVLLGGGFVAYVGGAFDWLHGPPFQPPAPAMIGRSKVKQLVGPLNWSEGADGNLDTGDAKKSEDLQLPGSTKQTQMLRGGSKSID